MKTCGNYTDEERHIIWQYKYLGLNPERLPKKERKILEDYIASNEIIGSDTKKHTENMYQKNIHNIVEYNREEKEELPETAENSFTKRKLDKYELYKQQQELKKQQLIKETEKEQEKVEKKNQILNF